MRFFYNILVLLGLPFVGVYWLWRAFRDASYRANWWQRFGFGHPVADAGQRTVWIHAVSVGEVQAAAPLIRALQHRLPGSRILITTVTPTGGDRVRLLFGDTVTHAFAPYDVRAAVRRFYDRIAPSLAIIIETELWPNLYNEAGERSVPLVLASARISPRSMPRYRRLVSLFRDALSNGIIIAAQSEADRQRFVELGAPIDRTFVSGNIKFDFEHRADLVEHGKALRTTLLGERPIWIAASTHDGEDDIVIAAHQKLCELFPDALLILVPRHPARFDETADKLVSAGVSFQRRTVANRIDSQTTVMLGDTMGEVNLFYAASDIAFVGGSLVPIGGHNILEPAALSLPILAGPHLYNAQEIATLFRDHGAINIVENTDELFESLQSLFRREKLRKTMGGLAWSLLADNRGAVDRLLNRLEPFLQYERSRDQ